MQSDIIWLDKKVAANTQMARGSDEREFIAELYRTYSDKIFRFLVWQSGDEALAEDLTGEVFSRAWNSREKLAAFEKPGAWLYRVARNLMVDHWRKQRPLALDDVGMIASPINIAQEFQTSETEQNLRKIVQTLPPDMRTVIVLRFFEQLSCEEVAGIMKKTSVNVRVLQYRALKLLKRHMK